MGRDQRLALAISIVVSAVVGHLTANVDRYGGVLAVFTFLGVMTMLVIIVLRECDSSDA
jgi:hypothetical protein